MYRLDFLTFSIAQPNAETVCDVDNFKVIGATNKVPIICGENHGQHSKLTDQSRCIIFNLNWIFLIPGNASVSDAPA